ncbi:MAG TPA: EAL domain-containing protein [Burkholderiales bacterium]|nr:EAL domain-containing protein [Burkholderiales bacterium]
MKISSLQSRIIIFFVILMLVVQFGGFLLINTAGVSTANKTIGDELQTGERVFNRLLAQKNLQLTQGARILSSDFAFREALASNDRETILSALTNHGARINAQKMMLVGLDQIVIADTKDKAYEGKKFPLPKLIALAASSGNASSFVILDGHLYQIVVVPVLAPVPIAWVAMGFVISDQDANDLRQLTNLNVSFLSRQGASPWALQATSLPSELQQGFDAFLSEERLRQGGISTMPAGEDNFVTLVSVQPANDNERVVAVLQRSLNEALEPFKRLQKQLLIFSLMGIGISIIGSVFIARGIARPVQQLAKVARRIAAGDYSDHPKISREDEIGDLSLAFDHMREGIEARESKIMDLAYRDTLTGLPNRALFTDRLQQAVSTSRRARAPVSVLVMDLDHFKYVNDTLGHHVGDLLLCEVAKRLQEVVRRQSDTVARLGGDEFAILLPTDDIEGAQVVAHKVIKALDTPMTLEGQVVDTRASIGVVTYPMHGEDMQSLLRRADVAMYMAKRNNSGFAIYDARFDQHTAERLSLMSELKKAVEENELLLYYQPKIDLNNPDHKSVEALVRWRHPQRGFVPPIEFIPFAEQTGYIKAITKWVLEQAIAQCAAWGAEGLTIDISVNISARDLMSSELPTWVLEALSRHGCQAQRICLEITESAILDDPNHALENLNRLHALGCKLSIDDYGTGYSSLSYLKRLRMDELKIDKSFVMGMVDDREDAIIVRSTIELAHNMGLKVVAEGVETQAILDMLREMHCDIAQGYLLSKPIPPADLSRWMRESPWIGRRPEHGADGGTSDVVI